LIPATVQVAYAAIRFLAGIVADPVNKRRLLVFGHGGGAAAGVVER